MKKKKKKKRFLCVCVPLKVETPFENIFWAAILVSEK